MNYFRIISLFILIFQFNQIYAITWTGAIDNDWHNPGNWDTGVLPTLGDDVFFLADAQAVISSTTKFRSLFLDDNRVIIIKILSGALMSIDGELAGRDGIFLGVGTEIQNDGSIVINNLNSGSQEAIENFGTISNSGSIGIGIVFLTGTSFDEECIYNRFGGRIDNFGTITIADSEMRGINNDGVIDNKGGGTITIASSVDD
ncbi:MAG: hypothetical protein AAGK97_07220, partial [Bacteroidota bacterium]